MGVSDAYDAAVMSDGRLPERIDPLRLAEGKRILRGVLDLASLPRFGAYLTEADGKVQVEMEFGVDEEGIRFVHGRLATEVGIACQRCLESFRLPLESEFQLGVVTDERDAERLPDHYEPLLVGSEPAQLKDIVEDELILSLPIVPKHPDARCPGQKVTEQEEESQPQRENPFAVLAKLKTNHKS
jgi:uncharacterized protein